MEGKGKGRGIPSGTRRAHDVALIWMQRSYHIDCTDRPVKPDASA